MILGAELSWSTKNPKTHTSVFFTEDQAEKKPLGNSHWEGPLKKNNEKNTLKKPGEKDIEKP